jgi:hypothetical protein
MDAHSAMEWAPSAFQTELSGSFGSRHGRVLIPKSSLCPLTQRVVRHPERIPYSLFLCIASRQLPTAHTPRTDAILLRREVASMRSRGRWLVARGGIGRSATGRCSEGTTPCVARPRLASIRRQTRRRRQSDVEGGIGSDKKLNVE